MDDCHCLQKDGGNRIQNSCRHDFVSSIDHDLDLIMRKAEWENILPRTLASAPGKLTHLISDSTTSCT